MILNFQFCGFVLKITTTNSYACILQ